MQYRQYQIDSIESLRDGFRDGHVRQVLAAPTGAGKSVIMLSIIQKAVEKGSRVIFICERRILVEQFSRHLDAAGIAHGVLMAKHWRFRPQELVQVASAQTLEKMESLPAFDICFVDELHACFVAGTLIDGKPIETLKVGDYVNSYNHETGIVESKKITTTFVHQTTSLVTVKTQSGNSITCTKDHPIYTQDGYTKADGITCDSVLQLINHQQHAGNVNVYTETTSNLSVSSLWRRLPSFSSLCVIVKATWDAHVLRCRNVSFRKDSTSEDPQKFSSKAGLPVKKTYGLRKLRSKFFPRFGLCLKRSKTKFTSFLRIIGVSTDKSRQDHGNQQSANAQTFAKWGAGKNDSQQPNEGRLHQEQGSNAPVGDRSQAASTWWEWSWYDCATGVITFFSGRWVGCRIVRENGLRKGAGLSYWFKDRPSQQIKNDCNRSGWSKPQQQFSTGAGCAEEFFTRPSRVVCIEIQEQGNLIEGRTDSKGNQFVDVFNIEVEGNHNYFANGLLVHNCMRQSIINMIKTRPNLKIVGASATPFHPKIAEHFSKVTSVTTMRELVGEGFLVPFRVFVAHEIDTKGLKVIAGEWKKDDLEKRGQQIVGDVVADYVRISNEVFGGYRKTICFSCGIAHGADLAKKFNEAGINAIQISSNDDDEYKAEVLADFAKPDTDIKVVISVAILSRGFDQSDVDHVILARPLKKSFSEHVQMVGRGARIHPEKKLCVIQDNSGNWLRFQDSWDTLYGEGVTELTGEQDKKSRKEPSDKEKKESKCPKCSVVWQGDVCTNCGHVRERRSDVVDVPGEMSELGSGKVDKFSSEFKEAWYQSMLGHLKSLNKNEGRAYFLYKEKFGVYPKWKKEYLPATPEVIGYFTKANIAYSYRKAT